MTYKMHSYDFWSTYLAGGRKKYMRPLYEYGMIIEKENKWQAAGGDLQIKARWAGNLPFITVHNDDSFTLQGGTVSNVWGGSYDILKSQGVRYRMWKYTGLHVFQKNYKIHVLPADHGYTPSKIQGCRRCAQTGKVDGWCSALACWDGIWQEENGVKTWSCSTHPKAVRLDNNYYKSWHENLCPHGFDKSHPTKRTDLCYSCAGSGKRDYGNKSISLLWDGSPLRVKDQNIVPVTGPGLNNLERLVAQYV